jgi:hypothetical protein
MEAFAAGCFTVVFLVALWAKIDGWQAWSATVGEWFSMSVAARVASVLVPAFEAVAILTLILNSRAGLRLSALLLLSFGLGAGYLAARGVRSTCACFGAASPSRISFRLAARNVVAGLAAVATSLFAGTDQSQPLAAVAAAMLIAVAIAVIQEHRILTQRSRPALGGSLQ